VFVRLFLLLFLFLIAPLPADAKYLELWLFQGADDVDPWRSAGFAQATLEGPELVFSVTGSAALYRPLPERFEEVDALSILLEVERIERAELLFLETNEQKEVSRRFRLELQLREIPEGQGAYVPMSLYWPYLRKPDTLAFRFTGTGATVRFGGVLFHDYSFLEKLLGAWRSFITLAPFDASTINVLVGPVIVPDIGPAGPLGEEFSLYTSWNAYLYLLLALIGTGLLAWAAFRGARDHRPWMLLRQQVLTRFALCIALLWILYDFRMGVEVLAGVWRDHRQLIAAPESTFRDRGRFYDFALFARGLVRDREQYEVLLPAQWPYLGSLRYYTYPALPNRESKPISDTWVVYARPEITVSEDGRLVHGEESFTRPGTILGWFSPGSFVFREHPPASS
jgi:hypothetical protein